MNIGWTRRLRRKLFWSRKWVSFERWMNSLNALFYVCFCVCVCAMNVDYTNKAKVMTNLCGQILVEYSIKADGTMIMSNKTE